MSGRITCSCCRSPTTFEDDGDDEYDDTKLIFEVASSREGGNEMGSAVVAPLLSSDEGSDDGTPQLRSRPIIIVP